MKKTAKQRKNNDGTLWLYGDSVTRRFYQDTVNTSQLCNGIFKKCDHVVNKIYNTRPGKASRDSKDLNLTRIESELESALREPTLMNNANSAILVNYGLHFVMDTPFSVFIDVMETVTRTLQKWKHLMKGTIIWRSINAMNKWKYGWPDNLKKHDKEQRFLTEPVSLDFVYECIQNLTIVWDFVEIDQTNIRSIKVLFPKSSTVKIGKRYPMRNLSQT